MYVGIFGQRRRFSARIFVAERFCPHGTAQHLIYCLIWPFAFCRFLCLLSLCINRADITKKRDQINQSSSVTLETYQWALCFLCVRPLAVRENNLTTVAPPTTLTSHIWRRRGSRWARCCRGTGRRGPGASGPARWTGGRGLATRRGGGTRARSARACGLGAPPPRLPRCSRICCN